MKASKTSFSDLVVEYHKLYAQTKKPEYLEIAAILGKIPEDNYDEVWEAKVNAGCDREGIPRIYPKPVDNAPLPTTKEVE